MNLEILKQNKTVVIGLVLVTLFFLVGYVYIQNKNGNPVIPGQKPDIAKQDQSIIEKVGKLIILPTNETPQIATVTDKTKLGDQNFFANAENGDKVLIYVVNKKAILYRPSLNKIIEVGPLGEPSPIIEEVPSSTPSGNPTEKLKVTPELPPPIR